MLYFFFVRRRNILTTNRSIFYVQVVVLFVAWAYFQCQQLWMIYGQYFKSRWHVCQQKEIGNTGFTFLFFVCVAAGMFHSHKVLHINIVWEKCVGATQLRYIPWAGEKTFKYKQSSDWFCKNGSNRFRYSSRPFGIFSNAPVSFWMLGSRCGQTGLNLSAIRIPFHGDGARVGLNLKIYMKKCK